MEMSCVNQNSNVCAHTFPADRKLKPQIMCVLLKNWRTTDVNATLEIDWIHANATANDTDSNKTAPVKDQPPVAGSIATRHTMDMVAVAIIFLITIV